MSRIRVFIVCKQEAEKVEMFDYEIGFLSDEHRAQMREAYGTSWIYRALRVASKPDIYWALLRMNGETHSWVGHPEGSVPSHVRALHILYS